MKKYSIILFFLYSFFLHAQEDRNASFIPPFDFPLSLSGNFGELRSNHFHGGLDFKTEGVEGKIVRCIEDGYVSRITVTGGGYGNALYINHPNGYTSIYGHLKSFAKPIAGFVENYQYENETFSVDIELDSTQFVFRKGEMIAYSGNTGYSFGPHLHMEIRHTVENELIDPLQFYLSKLKDTRSPIANAIMIYPQRNKGVVNGNTGKQSFAINSGNNATSIDKTIEAWGEIGLGISAFDYMDGTSNKYGVRSVTLYVDSMEIFRSEVDRFFYSENRMINSWTDFAQYKTRNSWYMKSFIEPGNKLRLLYADEKRGIITIDEERDYPVKYILKDLHGNTSVYQFKIKGKMQEIPERKQQKRKLLKWDRINIVQESGLHLIIPRDRLYDDLELDSHVKFDPDAISLEYQVSSDPVPLHRSCDLWIRIKNMPSEDTGKYYIARKAGNRSVYIGGEYEDGWLHTSISELGTFLIKSDTIPPRVEAINKNNWRKNNKIVYKISDSETGIKRYKGVIDGQFALFEFDAKSGRIACTPKKERMDKKQQHTLQLTVEDNRGNISVIEEVFNW